MERTPLAHQEIATWSTAEALAFGLVLACSAVASLAVALNV
jgi:hypothetical protein